MQRAWDIKIIFPIKDAASAALMLMKADCLYTAGIINEAEKQYVHSKARVFLDDATLTDAALLKSRTAFAEEHSRAWQAGTLVLGFQNAVGGGSESS